MTAPPPAGARLFYTEIKRVGQIMIPRLSYHNWMVHARVVRAGALERPGRVFMFASPQEVPRELMSMGTASLADDRSKDPRTYERRELLPYVPNCFGVVGPQRDSSG